MQATELPRALTGGTLSDEQCELIMARLWRRILDHMPKDADKERREEVESWIDRM
jgi:hypothetical protein